jgi:hypothetical protein
VATTLKEIEVLAQRYATARGRLADDVRALNGAIEEAKREYLPSIKRHVASVKDAEAVLHTAIEGNPHLFTRPRTVTVHGVKIGFRKGEGKISFDDADKVVALIEKHLPELAETLVAVTKKPMKDALLNLSVEDLKRIGCKVTGTSDQVVIKDTTSDVDKLVAALLAEDEEVEA